MWLREGEARGVVEALSIDNQDSVLEVRVRGGTLHLARQGASECHRWPGYALGQRIGKRVEE